MRVLSLTVEIEFQKAINTPEKCWTNKKVRNYSFSSPFFVFLPSRVAPEVAPAFAQERRRWRGQEPPPPSRSSAVDRAGGFQPRLRAGAPDAVAHAGFENPGHDFGAPGFPLLPSLADRTTRAVILASDCNPRWLTKHIPTLASSRQVPVILVKDNKRSSLRLGQLVKLKTALAIGIKAKGSAINETVDEILGGSTSAEYIPEVGQQLHA
ncbi:hypothetical protein Cni_G18471 [Canna indica]|uniref:Ribosomal protein eL8/eL30/eS12/Gadd45 domain-containing protein n=1 Tax=Canna indica TaxID=4628 RepID=A0AAQ3QHQ2_9LILI|nr:hypothetical protein Cni_G18471 [Canna indica]